MEERLDRAAIRLGVKPSELHRQLLEHGLSALDAGQ
jgi:hypothetical protein